MSYVDSAEPSGQRHVGPLLATAIVVLRAIFVWLLLRDGYAPSTRWAAFIYAAVMTTFGVLATELGR